MPDAIHKYTYTYKYKYKYKYKWKILIQVLEPGAHHVYLGVYVMSLRVCVRERVVIHGA